MTNPGDAIERAHASLYGMRRPKKIRIPAGKRPASLDLTDISNMRFIIGNVNIDAPVEIPVGELWELLRLAGRALEDQR